jgi:hypothetical protein
MVTSLKTCWTYGKFIIYAKDQFVAREVAEQLERIGRSGRTSGFFFHTNGAPARWIYIGDAAEEPDE